MALINSVLQHVESGTALTVPDSFYNGGDWEKYLNKFLEFLQTGTPKFSIYVKGNGKLPFHAFSSLPGKLFCPGAGPCLEWCYSFRAWRYPAAFFRQLQNQILLTTPTGRKHLSDAFDKIPDNLDFRLYVDGDFSSLEIMDFWFGLIKSRPTIRAYGYSKSWNLFVEYAKHKTFPENYQLNASSGSRFEKNNSLRKQIEKLSCYRGEFIAIPTTSKMPNIVTKRDKFTVWAKELRNRAKLLGIGRAFVCPGKCGNCLPSGGHACGSKKFKNVPVIIGIH